MAKSVEASNTISTVLIKKMAVHQCQIRMDNGFGMENTVAFAFPVVVVSAIVS